MTEEFLVTTGPGFAPSHPGEILREDVLPALGISKAALADHLGISRQSLYDVLREKRKVTADVAARLRSGRFHQRPSSLAGSRTPGRPRPSVLHITTRQRHPGRPLFSAATPGYVPASNRPPSGPRQHGAGHPRGAGRASAW